MKKLLVSALSFMMCLSLVACTSEPKVEEQTYTASAQGFASEVTVTLTMSEGKITAVDVDASGETESVGQAAVEDLVAQVLEAQSASIDGVSSATMTSNAVKEAVNACLKEANGTTGESASLTDGTYEETVYGNNYDVPFKVATTFEGGKITNIEVTDMGGEWSCYDTTILDAAKATIIPRILESQSVAVDATTGATASSSAIRYAVRLAIEEAGGDVADFSNKVEKSTEVVELDYDVVVVGLGAAGISAYYSAASNGATVLGIDKAAYVGGNSITTGGPLCVNPSNEMLKPYDENGNEIVTDEEAFIEMWEKDVFAGQEGGGKPELIEMLVHDSGDVIDWTVEELGFAYIPIAPFTYPDLTVYACYDGTVRTPNDEYVGALEKGKTFNEKNDYMLEVEGRDLIMNEDGSVGGVVAVGYDGTTYNVKAKSVILCTGGFAGSDEMMKKYLGYTMGIFGMYHNDGKMIQAAIDNGAATYNIGTTPLTHNARTVTDLHMEGVSPAHQKTLTAMVLNGDVLAVNDNGARFTSETDMMGLGETNSRANGSYYVIVDESYFNNLKENGFSMVDFMVGNRDFSSPFSAYNADNTPIEPLIAYFLGEGDPITEMDTIVEAGKEAKVVFEGATVEELAELINAPELVDAVRNYNSAIVIGEDTEFGKDLAMMHPIGVHGEKVYAVKAKGFCFSTSGALDVNENIEVLDTKGNVIPGLYACGTDSMGVLLSEESGYMDYGGVDHGWCFVSGKLAGANAAEFSKN